MGKIKCFLGLHKWRRYWDFDSVWGWDEVLVCIRCGATKVPSEAPEKEGEDG